MVFIGTDDSKALRFEGLAAHSPAYINITQIQGLPTMIFIGTDDSKPALRSEGLMTAETIKSIIKKDLLVQSS